ncbi:hypothetical protein EYF80_049407 [Liparis tanakae]|uniref:Uncharacterized protein n=1 Tax=Liparis tanakae TaxID=230148 RepID=A0A4Z2FHN3_9TELE|nr:hypothetical protein EYF80_049407 [Liparis tanakae]
MALPKEEGGNQAPVVVLPSRVFWPIGPSCLPQKMEDESESKLSICSTPLRGEVGVSYLQTAAGRLRHCCCAYFCHVRSNTCHKEIIEIDQHFIAIPNRDRKIAQPYSKVGTPEVTVAIRSAESRGNEIESRCAAGASRWRVSLAVDGGRCGEIPDITSA